MKNIEKILEHVPGKLLSGNLSGDIEDVIYDSRKIIKGCAFVCLKGASFDGHKFAAEAAEKGARLIVAEEPVTLPEECKGTALYLVSDTREALAWMSAAYFDYPGENLHIIGITGTKGKTTSTFMVKSILEDAGYKTGLIGTIGTLIDGVMTPSGNTTPESYVIQKAFREMADKGCSHCVMEVSSQGLKMKRTDAIPFDIGVFTNISPDHIGPNEHASFEEYLSCKGLLFKKCRTGIFNSDDPHWENVRGDSGCRVRTFGMNGNADLLASDLKLEYAPGRLGISFDISGEENGHIYVDQPGRFSVYNALTAIAVAHEYGVPLIDVQKALKNIYVKGRIELVHISDDFSIMIDYAHNAVALESLLTTLKEYDPARLVTIFGCGGNRSKLRRFEMGEVSGKLSDLTVITSDNPRFEKPEDIIADIETGIKKTSGKYVKIPDRAEAVKWAVKNAEKGDVIVLAGKGHEDYQEICGVKHHMDERELIMNAAAAAGLV